MKQEKFSLPQNTSNIKKKIKKNNKFKKKSVKYLLDFPKIMYI